MEGISRCHLLLWVKMGIGRWNKRKNVYKKRRQRKKIEQKMVNYSGIFGEKDREISFIWGRKWFSDPYTPAKGGANEFQT